MFFQFRLYDEGEYIIKIEADIFLKVLEDVVMRVAEQVPILLSQVKFEANKEIKPESLGSIASYCSAGITVELMLICLQLDKDNKFAGTKFVCRSHPISLDLQSYVATILGLYILLMIRGKPTVDDGEEMPRLLVKNKHLNLINSKYTIHLGDKGYIYMVDWSFIKRVDVRKLPGSMSSRLGNGSAGSRPYMPFRNFSIESKNVRPDAPKRSLCIALIIANKVEDGPFYEMHPLFTPADIAVLGVKKNLENLMLDVFTEEYLNIMVAKKILREPLVRHEEAQFSAYLEWTTDTFSSFKTLIYDADEINNYNKIREVCDEPLLNSNVKGSVKTDVYPAVMVNVNDNIILSPSQQARLAKKKLRDENIEAIRNSYKKN